MSRSSDSVVRRGELTELRLSHRSGATAAVVTQGAHVTSWVPASGDEVLFLGGAAEFARRRAIRGGIPVVFPQFAELGPLPKHGIVRTVEWDVREHGDVSALLGLTSSDATRALWPFDFAANVRVELDANSLLIRLEAQNTSPRELSFTAALHTYLQVRDVEEVRVHGFSDYTYSDRTRGNERFQDQSEEVLIREETDRVYDGSPEVELLDPGLNRGIRLRSTGFSNVVVWNPWRTRASEFSGLEPDDYRNFLCVEPAVVTRPVSLEPGRVWSGAQELSVRPLG